VLAYIGAHEDLLGPKHGYTVITAALKISDRAAKFIDDVSLRSYYAEEAENVFKPIRDFFKQRGVEATYIGAVGQAAECIAKQASSSDYDLLIMGSHGYGNLGNLVMGSVATQVLARCTVPVLIVR
jgi:nucleotide-binding universal stress UspA family protein